MSVRAINYWDCETKSTASNDRYRFTFDQTYCLGRQVSIDLSPNILFREIGIDISDDRYRYVDLSPFYCFSVGEQRRSKKTRLGTINPKSPFLIHAARPSSPAENPRILHCLSLLCPELKADGLNHKVITICVCSMRSSSLQCLERPVCVPLSSFLYPG